MKEAKTPYRIIFYEDDQFTTWEFDETVFETAEEAYEAAIEKYPCTAIRIVKLCYPTDIMNKEAGRERK